MFEREIFLLHFSMEKAEKEDFIYCSQSKSLKGALKINKEVDTKHQESLAKVGS